VTRSVGYVESKQGFHHSVPTFSDFSDWNPRDFDLDASLRAAHFELMSKPFVEVDVLSELGLDGSPIAHLVVRCFATNNELHVYIFYSFHTLVVIGDSKACM
jgi:hypothetical protein